MSLDAMRWAKKVKTGRASAKSVLTWMADMCGADLTAYPSISALSEATELDRKTVQSGLQYLVAKGLIEDTGERRGRTKQIPVYRLLGVEESIEDAEHTRKWERYQNRDRLNDPNSGIINPKEPKNGRLQNNQTIPFFPLNDPKNGIRNPPEKSKDINPTHNGGLVEPVPLQQVPDYPGQPSVIFPAAAQVGKFPMHAGWQPSQDFHRMAALWGRPVPAGINLTAELNSFIAYWQAEGKVFMQVQWEQKFANHLQRAGADKRQIRGNNHAGLDAGSTANAAVQQIRAARAQQQRSRGPGVDVLGGNGGNLFQPVDGQKRSRALQSLDGTNWVPDNGADGQYLQCPDSPLRRR